MPIPEPPTLPQPTARRASPAAGGEPRRSSVGGAVRSGYRVGEDGPHVQAQLEERFHALAVDAEAKIRAANRDHLVATRVALDSLRNENVVQEAEQNPEFREKLRELLASARGALREMRRAASAAI